MPYREVLQLSGPVSHNYFDKLVLVYPYGTTPPWHGLEIGVTLMFCWTRYLGNFMPHLKTELANFLSWTRYRIPWARLSTKRLQQISIGPTCFEWVVCSRKELIRRRYFYLAHTCYPYRNTLLLVKTLRSITYLLKTPWHGTGIPLCLHLCL